MQETQETWVQSLGREGPLEEKWQPTPVFLAGECHGQRSLMGYHPQGCTESYMTEATPHTYVAPSAKCFVCVLLQRQRIYFKSKGYEVADRGAHPRSGRVQAPVHCLNHLSFNQNMKTLNILTMWHQRSPSDCLYLAGCKFLQSKDYGWFAFTSLMPITSQCLTHTVHAQEVCQTEHLKRVIHLEANAKRSAHRLNTRLSHHQYSCLENSMDRGAWLATIHGVTKSQTRLSN